MSGSNVPDARGPLRRYQQLLADTNAEGERFFADQGQRQVVEQLEDLFQRLMRQSKQSVWQKWLAARKSLTKAMENHKAKQMERGGEY